MHRAGGEAAGAEPGPRVGLGTRSLTRAAGGRILLMPLQASASCPSSRLGRSSEWRGFSTEDAKSISVEGESKGRWRPGWRQRGLARRWCQSQRGIPRGSPECPSRGDSGRKDVTAWSRGCLAEMASGFGTLSRKTQLCHGSLRDRNMPPTCAIWQKGCLELEPDGNGQVQKDAFPKLHSSDQPHLFLRNDCRGPPGGKA